MDRARQLLRSLSRDARVIEIGPSFSPLAPKRDGWNTFIIDHASREELIRKYHDQSVERIEEVDFVWTGGSIADAVPVEQHGTFDAFVASHVIEHTTDIVTFLRAAETLLRPDGVVILAVPDKRKCFDFFRNLSSTADAIAAFLEKRDRHTLRTHIDYALYMALKSNTEGAWAGDDTRPAVPCADLGDEPHWRAAAQFPGYTDAHAWIFVPSSFSLMILELAQLGYLDLKVEDLVEQHATEFFVWLRKGAVRMEREEVRRQRAALMERVVIELADQARQLPQHSETPPLSAQAMQNQLLKAAYRTDALRSVLAALRSSIGRFGLNRSRFRTLIAEASQKVPANLSAAVQHQILLTEATRVLDGVADTEAREEPDLAVRDSAVLVVPLSAAQFADPLLAGELERERQKAQAVRVVLDAVLASLRARALDRRRFKALVTEAARGTPDEGPKSVRHTVLYEETRRILERRRRNAIS
jgi:SAM-dependent methyltransferase